MYAAKSLAVVVPAHNEGEFIEDVIETIPEYVDTTFLVDDHSTDDTWKKICSYADPNDSEQSNESGDQLLARDGGEVRQEYANSIFGDDLVAIRHAENGGRGAAVKTGYRLALDAGHDVVAVMDGDGQMDPDVLDRIVHPVATGEADYAKGNRLVNRQHCSDMSNWRLFGNVLLSILTKVAAGQWHLRDPQNGYTAVSADALREISLDDLYDEYGFLNDVLIRMDYHGLRVVDVPMEAVYADEESGIKYRTFVPNLSMLLLRGFAWRMRGKYVNRAVVKDWNDEDVG